MSEYETRHGRRLLGLLGAGRGQDGFVMRSDRLTAVKFFDRLDRFEREWEVYHLLTIRGIHNVAGRGRPRNPAAATRRAFTAEARGTRRKE